jgi:nicotinamide mononucleotide transporter
LLCVWLTAKQSIWNWPLGLISVSAFIVTFYNAKLYPDVGLHIIYFMMGIYGWFNWGQIKNDLSITGITLNEAVAWITIIPFGSISIGYFFSTYSQSDAPYIDSTITVISLIANYLLCRKILENWILWMIVDVIAVGLYSYKGLYLTAGLYVTYLIICVIGYKSWKKELQA